MMIVHHETEEEDDDTQEETFGPPQSDQKAEEQPEEKVEQFSVHDSNDDSKILKDVQVLAEELPEDNPYDVKPMIEPDMEQNEMPIARKRTHRRNNHQVKDLHDSKVNKMKTFYGVTG